MCSCLPIPSFIAKVILFIINFLVLIIGLALFGAGLLIQTQPSVSKNSFYSMLKILESSAAYAGITLDTSKFDAIDILYSFTVALIICGLFLSAVSVLGLVGIICSLKPLLVVYFFATLVMFLAQAIIVLIIIINRDLFNSTVKPHLKDTIESHYTGLEGTEAPTLMWNGVMIKLECCGVDSYDDFTNATAWTKTINSVSYPLVTPIACCKNISSNYTCATSPNDSDSNWNTGCYEKIWDLLLTETGIVPIIVTVVLAFQLAILTLTSNVIKSMVTPVDIV